MLIVVSLLLLEIPFLSFSNSQSLLKIMSIESMMPSNQLIFCHPLLFPPSIFPSIRVFFNDSALCIRWPKYWSFYFSISPSNEYSGLISFRIDWFYLLAVQGTLKSSPQFKNFNSLALRLLYCTTLSSIQDYWKKNNNFDNMDLCWKRMCLFLIHCLGLSLLFFQGARIL